jgi:hypothetical protein
VLEATVHFALDLLSWSWLGCLSPRDRESELGLRRRVKGKTENRQHSS